MPRVIVLNRFAFQQTVPANTWTIVHNLNITSPVVDVWVPLGDTGRYINNDAYDVTFTNANTVVITFIGDVLVTGHALVT